jgi:hypothetical protein
MKKLTDFQGTHQARNSMSDGIGTDMDEHSSSDCSNSQFSLDDESIDESQNDLSSDNRKQIKVKVYLFHL